MTRLTSYTSSRREEKNSVTRNVKRNHLASKRIPGDRWVDISLNPNEYSKLNGDGNAIEMQEVTRSERSEDNFQTTSKPNVTNDDIEAWPEDGREPVVLYPSYPSAVHQPEPTFR